MQEIASSILSFVGIWNICHWSPDVVLYEFYKRCIFQFTFVINIKSYDLSVRFVRFDL